MDNIVTDCFHGKLDRQSAEERLNQKGVPGSFLLRESERKSGSYVLSYLGKNGINHFRITHTYGSYFIGGRQFDSLLDLLLHYSTTSNLYTDERLGNPIPPPEPVASRERLFTSILPYTKLAQSDELSFKKGDVFIFQNEVGDGWFWCRDVKSGESGLVFSQLLEELKEDIDPNEVFPWFHARLSKADAVEKLAQAGPGSFLVRPSDNSPGNYTLFYHVGSTVQRFLIVKNGENRYLMGGKYFDSIGQIVELYQREPIMEGHVLQYPVKTLFPRIGQPKESHLSESMKALKVEGKSEDIYNTVRISRETAKRKQSSEPRGWMKLKKGDIQKKWKNYYFVLNSRDRHLYYYEKANQTKPKGLIDLSYSFVYKVHETLFEWPQCFQLVERCLPCFGNCFYFRCEDQNLIFEQWYQTIRNFTSANQANKRVIDSLAGLRRDATFRVDPKSGTATRDVFEEKRCIYINLLEAHSIKMSQPYFIISYNQDIKVAKTHVKLPPTALFTDDGYFAFENVPPDIKSITISMQQNGKKSKATIDLPQFSIDLNNLNPDGDQSDKWYKFKASNSNETLACLRIRMSYSSDIIMELHEYEALEDLLCDPNTEILTILNRFCHMDHVILARALSNIFRNKGNSTQMLARLIEREILAEQETSSLFKARSLTTAIIESYLRATCKVILTECLREPVKRLLDDKICCELNSARLDSHNISQKACENFETLLDLLDEMVVNIYDSISLYPMRTRYILAFMQSLVKQKWPQESLARTRVVSGFLFLRLICPTILNPKQFNLIGETPSENAIRNLTLVAKCLQNLANLTETSKTNNSLATSILSTLDDYSIYPPNQLRPNEQDDYATQTSSILAFILSPQIESWMDVVNPFILKNKIGMVKFIDELCNLDLVDPEAIDRATKDSNNNCDPNKFHLGEQKLEPAHDLALIHDICEKYRSNLEQQAVASQAARRLVTIMDILSKHKRHYVNLLKNS